MGIQLKAGKRYVMRNGFLTGELRECSGTGIFQGDTYENPHNLALTSSPRSWSANGSWFLDSTLQTPSIFDIVEEYTLEDKDINPAKPFESTADIFKHLLEGGYVTYAAEPKALIGFTENKKLEYFKLDGTPIRQTCHANFSLYHNWYPAIPTTKIEWYENIPEQGILCWVHDHYKDRQLPLGLKVITGYVPTAKVFLHGKTHFKYAKPATLEEVQQYIYKGE